jgi:hypothetical protein|nr:MAG TPA: hypothetical protein [Caudoviricetes sp.]
MSEYNLLQPSKFEVVGADDVNLITLINDNIRKCIKQLPCVGEFMCRGHAEPGKPVGAVDLSPITVGRSGPFVGIAVTTHRKFGSIPVQTYGLARVNVDFAVSSSVIGQYLNIDDDYQPVLSATPAGSDRLIGNIVATAGRNAVWALLHSSCGQGVMDTSNGMPAHMMGADTRDVQLDRTILCDRITVTHRAASQGAGKYRHSTSFNSYGLVSGAYSYNESMLTVELTKTVHSAWIRGQDETVVEGGIVGNKLNIRRKDGKYWGATGEALNGAYKFDIMCMIQR